MVDYEMLQDDARMDKFREEHECIVRVGVPLTFFLNFKGYDTDKCSDFESNINEFWEKLVEELENNDKFKEFESVSLYDMGKSYIDYYDY